MSAENKVLTSNPQENGLNVEKSQKTNGLLHKRLLESLAPQRETENDDVAGDIDNSEKTVESDGTKEEEIVNWSSAPKETIESAVVDEENKVETSTEGAVVETKESEAGVATGVENELSEQDAAPIISEIPVPEDFMSENSSKVETDKPSEAPREPDMLEESVAEEIKPSFDGAEAVTGDLDDFESSELDVPEDMEVVVDEQEPPEIMDLSANNETLKEATELADDGIENPLASLDDEYDDFHKRLNSERTNSLKARKLEELNDIRNKLADLMEKAA